MITMRHIIAVPALAFTIGACGAQSDSPNDNAVDVDAEGSTGESTAALKTYGPRTTGCTSRRASLLSSVVQYCVSLGYKAVDDLGYPNGWSARNCWPGEMKLTYTCYK